MHQSINPLTAWLAGATGLVGGFLLKYLSACEACGKVVVLTRREIEASHPKVEQRVLDFAQLESAELPTPDHVFSALGTTIGKAGSQAEFRRVDVEIPLSIAQKAARAGARQFLLVSSVGANHRSKNFCLRMKGELEEAVSELPFPGVQIFRPSALMGPRQEHRLGERMGIFAGNALAPAMIGALRKFRPIQAEDVARAMVTIAAEERPGRQVYEYDQIVRAATELKKGIEPK